MAVMSYSNLIAAKTTAGSIQRWMNDSTIDVVEILDEAEAWIYERLRVREMLVVATGSFGSIGDDTIALPSSFLAPRHLMFTGVDKAIIRLKTPEEVAEAFEYDADGNRVNGKPTIYYPDATNLQFDRTVDKTYAYRFLHYAAPAALSTSNETNFLTDRYPRLLRCACMGFASEMKKDDDEKIHWLTLAEAVVQEIEISEALHFTGEMDMQIDGRT